MSKLSWSSGVRSYLSSWFPRLIWRKRRAKLRQIRFQVLALERLESLEAVNSLYNPLIATVGLTGSGLLAGSQTTVAPLPHRERSTAIVTPRRRKHFRIHT